MDLAEHQVIAQIDGDSRSIIAPAEGRQPNVLLLMEDYRESYTNAVKAIRESDRMSYENLAREAFSRSIYYGDAYLDAFTSAGVSAEQVIAECWPLQRRWAIEHGVVLPHELTMRKPLSWFWTRRGLKPPPVSAMERVVDEQIRRAGPDILWVFSGVPMTDAGVKQWRSSADSAVLWWSCALVESTPYDRFDLILSSIRPLVEEFRSMGLRAEYMPHAFDARVLDRVRPAEHRTSRMAFVGNITPDHRERAEFLDALSRVIEVDFYGLGADFLPPDSPLRARAMGPVWGDDLYRVYAKYALVVHKNIDVAGTSPSAKRLFEATGMGACVLTEDNRELSELFEPGSEVVTYRTTDECIVKARELLAPSSDAYLIGRAGQRRTLEQHTYTRRVQRLLSLVDNVKAESRGVAVGSPTPRA